MNRSKSYGLRLSMLGLILAAGVAPAYGQQRASDAQKSPPPPANTGSQAIRLDVENIKQKYWVKGEESEIRVVQNRQYSKAQKFELGVFGGKISADPFLSLKSFGGSLGFYVTEFLSIDAVYWKYFVSGSEALNTLEQTTQRTANTNQPRNFLGGSFTYSPLYGKLSVLGAAIIYFDMHVAAGAGVHDTESGKYFTPFLGIGQKVFLSKWLALRLDYRLMRHTEDVPRKVNYTRPGEIAGNREMWSDVVTLGLSFFIDPF